MLFLVASAAAAGEASGVPALDVLYAFVVANGAWLARRAFLPRGLSSAQG
jgi:hypothetical protein